MRIGLRHFLIMAWLISAPPHAMRGETGGIPQDGDLLAQARAGERKLHNGWSVSPIGQQIELNDLVLNMVLTPGGKRLIALNSGYNTHAATLIEISTGKMLQQVPLPTSWYGLAWHPNGKILYVSGGNDRNGKHAPLHVFEYKADGPEYLKRIESPAFKDTLETPAANAGAPDPNAFPMPEDAAAPVEGKDVFWAGLAHHPSKDILYAANRTAGHVVVFDSKTGRIMARIRTEVNPYDLVLSADAKTLYVSNWASRSVSIIDTEANRVRRTIPVGTNPNDMILAKDGRLFVACSSDNSVYVINTAEERAVGRIVTSLWERDPVGSTPNFLALDEATRTLYVANADNNSVAVVDITTDKETRVLGFLPTGEYPCSVVWSAETNRIVVGTAKGVGLGSNLRGPKVGAAGGGRVPPEEGNSGSTKTLMKGTVNIFRPPASADELKELTAQVYRNTPYHRDLVYEARKPEQASVVPASIGERSAIKHVIYILKENRTYDQILGDLPKGNGDPRICLFGRDVTPNHHALAEQFGIFDNFCVDAEVSVDGHSWSNAAWATDFNEKTWPADYGGKIGRAPYTAAARPPEGYLWDYCARAGITYRSYGEMTMLPSLLNHVAPDYKGWGTELDVENADAFIKEFDQYEKNYDSPDPEKRLPNFSIVSLPHDHTYGGKLGKPSVKACVAANDLALGMMVERITHSKYWKETAIFVTEDDAQDGSDHVDCHRSIALVISPYSRRGIVDSTHYTTSSILRTIELLLGLPPMSQYDAGATPFYSALGNQPDLSAYDKREVGVNLAEKNQFFVYGAKESEDMDFEDFDEAPMFELNEIIWKIVKGADSEMPLPVRRYDVGAITGRLKD